MQFFAANYTYMLELSLYIHFNTFCEMMLFILANLKELKSHDNLA